MNREIKFRAWDKNYKRMVYPDGTIKIGASIVTLSGHILNLFEDEDCMQFTGLKDKNGTEIYEGDVVKFYKGEQGKEDSFYEYKERVYGLRGGFKIAGHNAQNFNVESDMKTIRNCMWCVIGHMNIPNLYWEIRDVEIIGNIHQNPELLTE